MPWRQTSDPYKIFISEIMLQQTQVSRVIEKYKAFIHEFPSFQALNKASIASVFSVWQGLGYNRRALHLKNAAKQIVTLHKGILPQTTEELIALPGIGKATAASIMAFAFNSPVVFIETNIRTVFIHFFFNDGRKVSDEELLPIVNDCLYKKNPRKWYWALMDFGTMLKKNGFDKNANSLNYVKQSRFEGSLRQKRGAILKQLSQGSKATVESLSVALDYKEDIVNEIVDKLIAEGFLTISRGIIKVKN